MNKRGFTLIELLAVLTVLAIISLITIPLVMNVISDSREKTYEESVVSYGKAVATAIAAKRMEDGITATSIQELEGYIKTSGNKVECNKRIDSNDNGITLRGCQVFSDSNNLLSKNKYIYINGKVSNEEETYSEMVNRYVKAVEDAVNKSGDKAYQIQDLIYKSLLIYNGEDNGDRVECDDAIQYEGNNVKLTNCKVLNQDGEQVSGIYTFSKDKIEVSNNNQDGGTQITTTENESQLSEQYNVGDTYTISGDEYYVISSSYDYMTLLKAEPLTVEEVNKYGAGHINRTAKNLSETADNRYGYGGIQYYSSSKCTSSPVIMTECTNKYKNSDVKYVVDTWAESKFTNGELATDSNGYQARLITLNELQKLGYTNPKRSYGNIYSKNDNIPSWIWNKRSSYWTMTESGSRVWFVFWNGDVWDYYDITYKFNIRPVINVYKSVLES